MANGGGNAALIPARKVCPAEPVLSASPTSPCSHGLGANLDTHTGCAAASPVGLIEYHVLHTLQLQVHLHSHVHQASGGSNDSARGVRGRSLRARDTSRVLLSSPAIGYLGRDPRALSPIHTHISGFSCKAENWSSILGRRGGVSLTIWVFV